MIGLGTILNVGGILLGGVAGMLFGKGLPKRFQETLMRAVALCVLFLGVGGCLQEMLAIVDGGLESGGTMMMIGSFAVGAILGELLDLEGKMERFGEWLKRKTKSDGDATFVDGFVTASLTVCIGAMAVVGAIQDGIRGDYSVLLAKAILDLIIVMILTASMGKGCIFSAIPVGLFRGAVTLLARQLEPLMTEPALSNLSLTGSMLIFCVGVNSIWGKKFKVANLLPTIFVAMAWGILAN